MKEDFEVIAHRESWSKRAAVCDAIDYLQENDYIPDDIPLPDIDYPRNKVDEVKLLTQEAGGYNFNTAMMHVMRKVQANINIRQVNTEITRGYCEFTWRNNNYAANREGRNKLETQKR